MKLYLKKDQADLKGFFGGHRGVMFSMQARCDIEANEQALVEKYKAGAFLLAKVKIHVNGQFTEHSVTITELLKGNTYNTTDLSQLIELEERLKEGCSKLKEYLEVMSSFGGEEVFDF